MNIVEVMNAATAWDGGGMTLDGLPLYVCPGQPGVAHRVDGYSVGHRSECPDMSDITRVSILTPAGSELDFYHDMVNELDFFTVADSRVHRAQTDASDAIEVATIYDIMGKTLDVEGTFYFWNGDHRRRLYVHDLDLHIDFMATSDALPCNYVRVYVDGPRGDCVLLVLNVRERIRIEVQ